MPTVIIIADISEDAYCLHKGGANMIPEDGEFMGIPVFTGKFLSYPDVYDLQDILLKCEKQKTEEGNERIMRGYSEHQEDDPIPDH